jgi:DNA-binding response OmpR family regulator
MRILIVEDDPKVAAYVQKGLKEAGTAWIMRPMARTVSTLQEHNATTLW